MQDGSTIPPWTTENLDRKDLLLMWKSITHALISTGHVAELYQELDSASRTGREDPTFGSQWAVESCRDPALLSNKSLQTAANSTENDRSVCGYSDGESTDEDTVMSSPSESDIDDNVCDVPSSLITEAVALSHYRSPLQSFEDIFAQQESLLPDDGLDVTPSIETSYPRVYTPASSPSPSTSDQEQWLNKGYIPAKQHIRVGTEGQDILVKKNEATPPRKTVRTMETRRLRLSDKKDLTPSDTSVVAQRLIKNDSVIYFLNNCRLIYESLMPSIVQQPLVCSNNSIEESVIAAFDTVQSLVDGKHIYHLLLRTVCIYSFSPGN